MGLTGLNFLYREQFCVVPFTQRVALGYVKKPRWGGKNIKE